MDWIIAGAGARELLRLIRRHWLAILAALLLIAAWEILWGPDATQDAGAETQQERELNKLIELFDAKDLAREAPGHQSRDLVNRLENDLWRLQNTPQREHMD